jgi:hypothetical protein
VVFFGGAKNTSLWQGLSLLCAGRGQMKAPSQLIIQKNDATLCDALSTPQ